MSEKLNRAIIKDHNKLIAKFGKKMKIRGGIMRRTGAIVKYIIQENTLK